MVNLDWYLPPSMGGQDYGLNEAGISNFKNDKHLARETVQNIIDAKNPKSVGIPKASFEILDIPVREIPGIDTFQRIHKACSERIQEDFSSSHSSEADQTRFMEKGADLLNGQSIPTLRIRDTNTVGLSGSDSTDDRSSRWYRLIRSQGSPNREGESAGTYGIGQRAPFAFSNVRMVLYSTMLPDGDLRFMGKFILCSCKHPDTGSPTQHIGFYGHVDEACDVLPVRSITEEDLIPERFKRTSPGTDIYIVGFAHDDLAKAVTRAVISDFYAAIYNSKIEVEIIQPNQDPQLITSETIENVLDQDEAVHGLRGVDLSRVRYSVQALKNPHQGKPYKKDIPDLGDVKLYICRHERATNQVSYMRSPMIKVYEKRFQKLREFQAVLVVDSDHGNDFLSRLEDPSHVRWHADELGSSASNADKSSARKALKELNSFIVETLTEIGGQSDKGAKEDIPDLAKLLPIEEDDECTIPPDGGKLLTSDSFSAEESPQLSHRPSSVDLKVTKSTIPRVTVSEDAELSGDGPGSTGGGGRDGGGNGDGQGGEGDAVGQGSGQSGGTEPGGAKHTPVLIQQRIWRVGSGLYRIVLSAKQELLASVSLVAIAEQGEYPIRISHATDLESGEKIPCTDGSLKSFHFSEGVQKKIEVTLDTQFDLSLRVEVAPCP